METEKYWTGIADVTEEGLPKEVIGALFRVLTFAENREMFVQKVNSVLSSAGYIFIDVEESVALSDFIKKRNIPKDHEIYGMLETAEKNKENVICGGIKYYFEDNA